MGNKIPPPRGLLIAAAILIGAALIAGPIIGGLSPEVLSRAVLVAGFPFIAIFVAIILGFVYVIWVVAYRLNGNIAGRTYYAIEAVIIGGIVLGVIGMFQPFTQAGYQIGFLVLLFSVLSFILWSHVTPSAEKLKAE
jgi:hypothetical protein